MAGLLTPFATGELVRALKAEQSLPVFIHSHDTAGLRAGRILPHLRRRGQREVFARSEGGQRRFLRLRTARFDQYPTGNRREHRTHAKDDRAIVQLMREKGLR